MPERTECPTPVIFEDKPGLNNTHEEKDSELEKHLEYQYFFSINEEPIHSTATYNSADSFLNAFLQGKEPALIFRSTAYQNNCQIRLSQIFPLYFPFGRGDRKEENRQNLVSKIEAIKHYLRLSLLQFQKPDFMLVLGQFLFRKLSIQCASVRCMSKAGSDGITLGESFCAITDEEILKMSKASNLKQSSLQCNDTLSTSLLHTVKT